MRRPTVPDDVRKQAEEIVSRFNETEIRDPRHFYVARCRGAFLYLDRYRQKKNIGYAMLPVGHAALGGTVSVDIPGTGVRRATIVPRPFVDPKKDIPKS